MDINPKGRRNIYRQEARLKKLEDAWHSTEEQWQQIFMASPVPMFTFGAGKYVQSINKKFLELFGYTAKEISTFDKWWILAYPNEKYRRQVKYNWSKNVANSLKGNKETNPIETTVTCKDKSEKYVETKLSKIGRRYLVIFTDLTERRKIEQMKTDLISIVSHQLRTPLGGLRWTLEMIMNGDMGDISKEANNALQQVYDSNQRLIQLVNDLLNSAHIEQGKIISEPKITNIKRIISLAVDNVMMEARKKNQRIVVRFSGSAIPKIKIDKSLFREVIINLISNASKYSPLKSVIKVNVSRSKEFINIAVIDRGIGIPKDQQEEVFKKLFRARNAVKKQTQGSGLGLYVVKSYLKAWGGKVSFQSRENKGTTFKISIPIKPQEII